MSDTHSVAVELVMALFEDARQRPELAALHPINPVDKPTCKLAAARMETIHAWVAIVSEHIETRDRVTKIETRAARIGAMLVGASGASHDWPRYVPCWEAVEVADGHFDIVADTPAEMFEAAESIISGLEASSPVTVDFDDLEEKCDGCGAADGESHRTSCAALADMLERARADLDAARERLEDVDADDDSVEAEMIRGEHRDAADLVESLEQHVANAIPR